MVQTGSLNILDIVVIAVVLISALLAFFRGFVQEVLAIAAWVGAGFAAVWGLPAARPQFRTLVHPEWLADAVAAGVIFLVTLLILALITHAISKRVRESALGAVDRSLGVLFGIARGAVIAVVAFIVLSLVFPPPAVVQKVDGVAKDSRPEFIREARTLPLLTQGADYARSIMPPWLKAQEKSIVDTAQSAVGKAKAAGQLGSDYNQLLQPGAPSGDANGNGDASNQDGSQSSASSADGQGKPTGYTASQKQSIDQLSKNNQ